MEKSLTLRQLIETQQTEQQHAVTPGRPLPAPTHDMQRGPPAYPNLTEPPSVTVPHTYGPTHSFDMNQYHQNIQNSLNVTNEKMETLKMQNALILQKMAHSVFVVSC